MRENTSNIGTVKEFNNGNINIKFNLDGVYHNESAGINLLWMLDAIDIYNIGEEFCLSNYDMGCMLYNCYLDKIYTLSFSELQEAFTTGKTFKLYARTPDKWDREIIKEWENE